MKMQLLERLGATAGLCQSPAQRFQALPQLLAETTVIANDEHPDSTSIQLMDRSYT